MLHVQNRNISRTVKDSHCTRNKTGKFRNVPAKTVRLATLLSMFMASAMIWTLSLLENLPYFFLHFLWFLK